ncbi:ATP-binding protein [Pseudonocardia tropica]|uniref:ATP-binding protein n=1 Tax=Pseudonocardia tropica TaxID=681289 RepID=A0ABV1JVR5_9PSEU
MSFRAGVEVGLQRAYASLLMLFAVGWSAIAVRGLTGAGPTAGAPVSTTGAAAFVTTAAVLTVRGIRTRLGPVDVGVVVLVAALVQVGYLVEAPAGLVVGYRSQAVVAAIVPLLTLAPPRWAAAGTGALVVLQVATSAPTDGLPAALLGVWSLVVSGAIAAVVAPVLRTAGARADAAAEAERAARITADGAAAEREAAAEFGRVLHDEVSAALRGAATGGVDGAQRRAAASRAVAALDGSAPTPPGDPETDVRSALDGLDSRTPRRIALPAEPVVASVEVVAAVRGAVGEALRNVDRHAAAGEARIELAPGPGIRVTVVDNGRGFDPAAHGPSAGVDESIVGRMRAVGGTATLTSAPGRGTTVRLDRPPDPVGPAPPSAPVDRIALVAAATGDVRRPLYALLIGYLAMNALVAALQPDQVPESRWFLPWYATVCVLAAALVVRAARGVGPVLSAAAALVAVGGAVAAVAVVPLADLLTLASWPIGATTPLLMVLVTVRRSAEALLAVLAAQVGIVAVLAAGPMSAEPPVTVVLFAMPMLVAPALGTLMAWLIGRTIRRLGRATIEANARRTRVEADAVVARVRRSVRDRRIESLHREVRPFLTAVAAGTEAAGSRRDTALRLDAAIRDELHLPEVLDDDLRTALDAARSAGCRVVLQPSAGARVEPGRVAALLRPALTGIPAREIVLGLHDDGSITTASLVVVPGRDLPVPDDATVTVRESTVEYAWLEVVVSGSDPQPGSS